MLTNTRMEQNLAVVSHLLVTEDQTNYK